MNWEEAQILIVPALMVLWQALKQIPAIEERKQYISIASIILGAAVTITWVLTGTELVTPAAIRSAVLYGMLYGASATGLYEFQKAVRNRNSS